MNKNVTGKAKCIFAAMVAVTLLTGMVPYAPTFDTVITANAADEKTTAKTCKVYLTFDDGPSSNTGRILDPYNRITIHEQSFRILRKEQWGKYVSLFAWGGEVGGVTLTGFHFPMENGRIRTAETLTVSNEIREESAEVLFSSGLLLMVESKDQP